MKKMQYDGKLYVAGKGTCKDCAFYSGCWLKVRCAGYMRPWKLSLASRIIEKIEKQ